MSTLIQDGWVQYSKMCIPDSTPLALRPHFRRAYFIGAQHLFVTLLNSMLTEAIGEDNSPIGVLSEEIVESLKIELMDFLLQQQASPKSTANIGPVAKPN